MQSSDEPTHNSFERLTAYLPLIWISLSFLAGIVLAYEVRLARSFWLVLLRSILPAGFSLNRTLWALLILLAALASLSLLIFLRLSASLRHQPFRLSSSAALLVSLCLVALLLGAARYAYTIPTVDANYVSWYNDRSYEMLVTGTLVAPPDQRDTYTNLRLQVSAVNTGDEALPVHGLILARVPPEGAWHYGDVVRLRGSLQNPPTGEDFSYRDYLAHQGIRAYMPDAVGTLLPFSAGNPLLRLVYAFKDQAVAHIYKLFPDPEASLLSGILLGDDNGLPAKLQEAYQNTGTAHIIAISGFNIAIIAGLFVVLFSRLLGKRKGALFALLGILLYTILVGATASVVRAAIMAGLAIFARLSGRRQNGLVTLAFTAALMAAFNPQLPWDVGFQLSFAATLGLVLYGQPLEDWAVRLVSRFAAPQKARKIGGVITAFLLLSLAAQLTTLPLMAWHFGRLSLVGLLTNPLVLPVQPAVMLLSGLALLLSFIYLPLGKLVAWVAWPFAAYTNRMVEFFNGLPYGVLVLGEFSFLFVVFFYLVLLTLTFARPPLRRTLRVYVTPSVIITALAVCTWLTWASVFARPDGSLHLTFLNVGSADAILIQTPGGRTILVDGGESPSILSNALSSRLPPLDHHIDWLVVASPQEQQLAAVPRILDRFPVGNVLWAGNQDASYSASTLAGLLSDNATPLTLSYPDAALDLGQGAQLQVVAVSPRGAVLLLEWQGFRALLPVGMNLDSLATLKNGKKVGQVTALLLADSGFGPLNPPEWIAALHPQVAVLSVAAGDPNGLPAQSVLDELSGTTLLRTDQNGWVEISTDGASMGVKTEK